MTCPGRRCSETTSIVYLLRSREVGETAMGTAAMGEVGSSTHQRKVAAASEEEEEKEEVVGRWPGERLPKRR
jgi:hypothetical protein